MKEDITLAQLRTFVFAARAHSFAKAAEQLDISQPSVSAQIKVLEDRLGCQLFKRRIGTTPVLTAMGDEALEEAETMLAAHNNLFELGSRSSNKILMRVSIGPYMREKYLRPLIPQIYRDHPNIELDLQSLIPPADVTRLVESGELDMAIYAESVEEELQPHTRLVCELPTVMIAPPGTSARLSAGQCTLDEFQFIFLGNRDVASRRSRKFLRELKVTPKLPTMFVEFIDSFAELVEEGKGVGRTMTYAVADRIAAGRVEALDISLPPIRRLVVRSPNAPVEARAIEEMLCEVLSV